MPLEPATPLDRLIQRIGPWLDRLVEPAHDGEHVRRVVRMADRLGRLYGADLEILGAAAWLHDLGRAVPNSGRSHIHDSIELAHPLMEEAGFPPEKRQAVVDAIAAHSFSHGVEPNSLEAHILRDADRLDALGAIGIARTFAYGGTFYDPEDPLARSKTVYEGDRYCVEHFHEKLFRLPDGLFTAEARRIARQRVEFMHGFLNRLESEASVSD